MPRARDAVRQQAQSRHVGGGEPDAEQHLEQHRAREAAGAEAEARARGRREQAAGEIDAPAVDAVGERGPVGNGGDVADEERAADEARLGVAQLPEIAQLRQQRRVGREAQHRQDVGADEDGRPAFSDS